MDKQLITFVLGENKYCIDIKDVKEIVNCQENRNLPQSADYILGLITIRNNIYTIIDLKTRLGMDNEKEKKLEDKKILILNEKDIGILVDNTDNIIKISKENLKECKTENTVLDNEYIKNIIHKDDDLIVQLDFQKIFKEDMITGESSKEQEIEKVEKE